MHDAPLARSRGLAWAKGLLLSMSLAVASGMLLSGGAASKSDALWSERAKGTPPLAQVPDFRKLAQGVVPCVVSIQVEQRAPGSASDFSLPDIFRGDAPPEFHGRGIGTGFSIRSDGLILTNNHVVEDAETIEVAFAQADGTERRLEAKLTGAAPEYDIALIHLTGPGPVPFCHLGDSAQTGIGDWVMAVGNPFGLSHSVSVGIVSAKERREINPSGRRGLYDFLQTDASINPGNSGGPLINMAGEVVGINTAINAAGSGIGFAIPINMVKQLLPSLSREGRFVRSWIGVRVQPLTDGLAASYGLKASTGALVSEVLAESPAQKGGLREGDVILQFAGKTVRDQTDLQLYASMAGVGEQTELVVWRDGHQIRRAIVLTAFPDAPARADAPATGGADKNPLKMGMRVADITEELKQRFDLEHERGAVVIEVQPGDPADRAGLRPGDVVLALNGQAVAGARDFVATVLKTKSGAYLRLQVSRPGGKVFIALQKP